MSTIDIVLSLPNKDLLKEEDLPEEVIKQYYCLYFIDCLMLTDVTLQGTHQRQCNQ